MSTDLTARLDALPDVTFDHPITVAGTPATQRGVPVNEQSTDECALCRDAGAASTAKPSDDLALCPKHWNRWLAVFLGEEAPCAAHAIRPSTPATERHTLPVVEPGHFDTEQK